MKKTLNPLTGLYTAVIVILTACDSKTDNTTTTTTAEEKTAEIKTASKGDFKEGIDYLVYDRVRLMDNAGFTSPAEAYSLLLPKGWTYEGEVVWIGPGNACAGTYKWFKAKSADGTYSFEMLPDQLYSWNTNPDNMQFNMNNSPEGGYCGFKEPVNAEQYLRNMFAPQALNNPEIVKIESNQSVIAQMRMSNEAQAREAMQYGAGNIRFDQSAINADVRWPDNTEGWVVLGVTMVENDVPNPYNGTVDKMYTTQIGNRFVFKYPAGKSEDAKNQFSVIMGSIRTNPWWNGAVNKFWKDVRVQKHAINVGKIEMMDAQTKAIGAAAIAKGNERLKTMDIELRNWEATQSSQDRMHTNFIKTIREVENYRDETGKYEMVSGYNHAWSRGDGTSFILSNNPNFDPSSVLQDQRWKEMKKVDD